MVKYRSFQYRLLHNAVILNNRMSHWQPHNAGKCTFCNAHDKNLVHFFKDCVVSKKIWKISFKYMRIKYGEELVFEDLDIATIVLNDIRENKYSYLNLLLLVIKQKLYAFRCLKKTPNAQLIIKEFEFIHKID